MKTLNVEQIANFDFVAATEERRTTSPDRVAYRVTKVTNSITPLVGEVLSHVEVAELCDSVDWKVIVV